MSTEHPIVELSRCFAEDGETTIVEAELALAGSRPTASAGVGAFIGQLMVRNARETSATFEMLYEGEKADHERTKEQLERALDRLDLIQRRMDWLTGAPDEILWERDLP